MSDAPTVTRPNALVAQVLDGGLRVAINKGSNAGIDRGDQFLVVHQGSEIIDPENGEALGRLEIIRGRGKIIDVKEKYSILESLETRSRPRSIGGFGIINTGERERAPFERVEISDLVKPV